jgi:F420-0:gamma-glutamyl ligase
VKTANQTNKMIITPVKTRIFKAKEFLADFIISEIPKLKDGSILVVTSKILALSQGRIVEKIKNRKEKEEWIRKESEKFYETKWCYLCLKDGHWCANGGIDESNSKTGGLILWPEKIYEEAEKLRKILLKHYKIKKLGILITDSRIFPLRSGVVGVALGYSGFLGLKSYVGKKDIFDRKFKFEKVNMPDSLASAAILVMGEGKERCPLAVIENAPVEFTDRKISRKELQIKPENDIYRVLFENLK